MGQYLPYVGSCAGCNYPGDYIGDTPYQAGPTTDCTVQDTCPGMPGHDPVHNIVRLTGPRWQVLPPEGTHLLEPCITMRRNLA